MKKWIALILALVAVLTLVACGETTFTRPLQIEDWGEAEGYNGKILGLWYNIQENAGDETVFGFEAGGIACYAASVDAKEAYAEFYTVDEENKTVSFYEYNEGEKGKLLDTAQIVEDGDVIYLIGEGIALAREADLEAARAAYSELAKPAK